MLHVQRRENELLGCSKPIEDGKFEVSSVVRGYHVYKETWTPFLTEHLKCKREEGSHKDRYAVAVVRHDSVVGHIAQRISAACSLFIQKNGSIKCTITGTRQYSGDLPQGGLEIPCLLTFRGDKKEVMKVRKLLGTKLQVPESNVNSPSKKRKLDVCIIESSMPETQVINRPWLSLNKIELSFADKELIIAGDELTDIYMNFAQAILKKQFPELSGLHSTLLLPRCSITGTDAVQILHCRGN